VKAIAFRLYVFVPVVRGNYDIGTHPIHPSEERVHPAFDLRDHGRLAFLPPPAGGIFPADTVNPVMRVLSVRFVDAANLQIHVSQTSYGVSIEHRQPRRSEPANPQIRGLAYYNVKKNARLI
jgi:hypothetical protein